MKLTAKTITDKQIRELRNAEQLALNDRNAQRIAEICEVALYGVGDRDAARARVAEILNERAEVNA